MKWKTLVGTMVLGVSLCTPSFAGGLLDRMLGMKGCGCDSTCCDTAPACSAKPSCGCESACGNGCGAAPSCGCESACGNGCAAAPSCGSGCGAAPSCGCESSCAAAPSCGCETSCCKPRRKPLLELLNAIQCKQRSLFSCHKGGCDSGCAPSCGCESACGSGCGAAPSCGCESACGSGCGKAPSCGCEVSAPCGCDSGCGCGHKRGGLLGKIFKKRGSCDALACDSCCAAPACNSCGTAPVAAPEVHGNAAPAAPAPIVDPSAYLQSNRRVIQATSYVR